MYIYIEFFQYVARPQKPLELAKLNPSSQFRHYDSSRGSEVSMEVHKLQPTSNHSRVSTTVHNNHNLETNSLRPVSPILQDCSQGDATERLLQSTGNEETNNQQSTINPARASAQPNHVGQCSRLANSSSHESSSTMNGGAAVSHTSNSTSPRPPVNNAPTYQRSSRIKSIFKQTRSCLHAFIYNIRKLTRETVWLMEILSFVVSLVALAVIIAILATHQDKSLPQWPTLISINSLVSIFTSILKAAMLLPVAEGISELKWIWFLAPRPLSDMDRFDTASRGPLGAFKFFRNYHNLLALLGAMIIILTLAIDPFT